MHHQDLTAAILAGGLGTRLRSVLPNAPKVLAPVGGRPFVTYLLDQLVEAKFREVILLTGHLGDEVQRELGDQYGSLRLIYSREELPLGTAGAIRAALPLLLTDNVLLMNGDSYFQANLRAFLRFHVEAIADLSMILARVEDTSRFGSVRLNPDRSLRGFVEKGKGEGAGWINSGVYLLRRSLVESIPAAQAVSLEREIIPECVHRGVAFGFPQAGQFIDVGTPESLAEAGDFFLDLQSEVVTRAT